MRAELGVAALDVEGGGVGVVRAHFEAEGGGAPFAGGAFRRIHQRVGHALAAEGGKGGDGVETGDGGVGAVEHHRVTRDLARQFRDQHVGVGRAEMVVEHPP